MVVLEAGRQPIGVQDDVPPPMWRRSVRLDVGLTKQVVGGLLGSAAVVPAIPGYPGITCPLRSFTGIPCPFCGTTTSVDALAHFELSEALGANPGAVLAVALFALLFLMRRSNIKVPIAMIFVVLVAMWGFQLSRFSVF